MLTIALDLTLGMLTLSLLLTLWRLLLGPDLPDRIMALDTLFINTVALLVVLGIVLNNTMYFEVGTIAFCKYVLRGDIIE
jgi:multicomponent K+:H+ antiporter subunit F